MHFSSLYTVTMIVTVGSSSPRRTGLPYRAAMAVMRAGYSTYTYVSSRQHDQNRMTTNTIRPFSSPAGQCFAQKNRVLVYRIVDHRCSSTAGNHVCPTTNGVLAQSATTTAADPILVVVPASARTATRPRSRRAGPLSARVDRYWRNVCYSRRLSRAPRGEERNG